MAACLTLVHDADARPRSVRPLRVLLIEDDRDLRSALADLLRLERMDVTEAENGLEALLLLRTTKPPPDVIVLDLSMPIMTGWEFREAQLRDATLAGVPVVVLSSQSAHGLSAAAALEKPCRPDDLLGAIARVTRAASETRAR
jgi:CheY-like chemotaxis protein